MNVRLRLPRYGSTLLLVGICAISFGTMIWVSSQESAIMDELAHIPSGYGYVRYLDYRLNPEHPPLVKALAGLTLIAGGFNFPLNHAAWQKDVNGQWEMGTQFFYNAGNDANRLIQFARFGPILLTVFLTIFIYIWAKQLMGRRWALLPTLFFGFSPNVLAHGHYVTTDVAAAFGVVFATYYFIRLLYEPTRGNILKAGLAFGLAQIGKFSAVLLVPYFIFLVALFALAQAIRASQGMGWFSRSQNIVRYGTLHLGRTVVVMAIGYVLVVYPIYALFTVNYPIAKQVSDTTFILQSFAGGPTPPGASCNLGRCLAELNIAMAGSNLLRPFAEYMLGVLMVLQRSAGGNTNYFLGEVSAGGWHHYFPVVYALKEPLPVVIMVLVALIGALIGIIRVTKSSKLKALSYLVDWLGVSFAEFAMISFIIFYWAYSMQSPLNIGFRHLFPTLPFIYILTAGYWKRLLTTFRLPQTQSVLAMIVQGFQALAASSIKFMVFIVLLIWFVFETIVGFPYYLSYFNELGSGVWGGYRYVTDSNYDWGQDMARLKTFVASHPEIKKIAVDYFGGGNPKYYIGAKEENWWSARGNPSINSGQVLPIHYLAVSVNTLQGATQKPVAGLERKPDDEYRWLTKLRPPASGLGNVPEPDYRVGTSIFVYKL